jgi:hypothetical protein
LTGRYEARNDDLAAQMADLTRRLARIEALSLSRPGISYGVVNNADFTTPPASTASGTFQVAYYLYPNGDAQSLEARFRVITPAAVTMEVRIVNDLDGTVISPTAIVVASTNGYLGLRARTLDGANVITARAEFRVASGAGTVRVGLLRIVGGNYQQGTF